MKNRIGEKFTTNQGLICEIIEYKNSHNLIIKFSDGNIKKTTYSHLQTGNVRNPYYRWICGVGYIGEGPYKPSIKSVKGTIYNTWHSILQRCYDPIKQKKIPTYIGCIVCDEWLCFQNFADFYTKNNPYNFHIDKDLLVKGNKIYSPDTCCFVPPVINNSLIKVNRKIYKYLDGIITKYGRYTSSITINQKHIFLGNYNTPEEAFISYKRAKEEQLKYLANQWKDKISIQAYNALINYEVEILE